jgi:hypothetical protein
VTSSTYLQACSPARFENAGNSLTAIHFIRKHKGTAALEHTHPGYWLWRSATQQQPFYNRRERCRCQVIACAKGLHSEIVAPLPGPFSHGYLASNACHYQQVYCVGMSCSLGEHDAVCKELEREAGLCMTLAYDGLTIGAWRTGTHYFTSMCPIFTECQLKTNARIRIGGNRAQTKPCLRFGRRRLKWILNMHESEHAEKKQNSKNGHMSQKHVQVQVLGSSARCEKTVVVITFNSKKARKSGKSGI